MSLPNREDLKMNLGEKIKEHRKQTGLSQEQFSERLNVSRQLVYVGIKWYVKGWRETREYS